MKHASILLLLTLAACGDSKQAAAPAKPTTADVGVAAKSSEVLAAEPVNAPAAVAEASKPVLTPPDVSKVAPDKATDELKKPDEEKVGGTKKEEPDAKKPEETPAKPADAPAAVPAKVEELSVQVLQEGSGAVVKRGDTVTLEYTISYMPKPAAEKKDEPKKKDGKSSKKSDSKKSDEKKADDKKADDAKPKEESKESDKPVEEKKEAAAEHKDEAGEKTAEKPDAKLTDEKPAPEKPADAKPSETKPADEKSTDAKPADAKPADPKSTDAKTDAKPDAAKPIEPLKPVIVASTKSFPTPFTVKLTETGKPKLLPGLVRGVEGLKVGTRARILVPAALAYGKDGNKSAGIPPETPIEIEVFVRDARE